MICELVEDGKAVKFQDGSIIRLPSVTIITNTSITQVAVLDGVPLPLDKIIQILLVQRQHLETQIADLKSQRDSK